MAVDTDRMRSRRALLIGGAGGVAALAAQAFGRAPQVNAVQGQPVIAGQVNTATALTEVDNTGGDHGLIGRSRGSEFAGLWGINQSANGLGVRGNGGPGGTGVKGLNQGSTGIGVHGIHSGTGSAVYGEATGSGVAVNGDTVNGIGVRANSTNGTALAVLGRARFSNSGKVSFVQGQSLHTVHGYPVEADTIVVATIQGNVAGTWVRGVSVSTANDTFTIRLNKAAPKALSVGYFIVN